jgi:hypothetical protein
MGMYTELHYNAELREDVPQSVIDILKFMVGDIEEEPKELPDHELFSEGSRWRYMLQMDSYYFDADTHSTLRYDEIGQAYYLCIRCNLKNYSDEIEHFIDWIEPYLGVYIQTGDFLGFYRYEENNEPTLIYRLSEPVKGQEVLSNKDSSKSAGGTDANK